jgi:hypothetical protein
MALVSMSAAKKHLRVTSDEQDADIALKLDQAEGIILDYLKHRLTNIASVSVANPTVITTDVPHGFTSGVAYPIAGTTTTPTINGSQVVTVTGSTTFTVPVNVTVGQSAAAGTVGAAAWTDVTVPRPVQSSILITLSHLHENRGDDMKADGDLWLAIERLLMRQRDPALA